MWGKMRRMSRMVALAAMTLPWSSLLAEDDFEPREPGVAPVIVAQQPGRPTLPPIEVRPDVVEPPVEFEDLAPSTGNASYPSLAEQVTRGGVFDLDGLNGLGRSAQSLYDMPQLATIIDRQTLDERMSPNMLRALQNEVGVVLQQTGAGQLSPFIRGLTGQQVLILVDGVRMNNSVLRAGPNQYAATIDPGMIDHIEVLRGSDSVMWGSDALGGVINIVTRGADPLRGNYSQVSFRQFVATADSSSYSRANVEGWVGGTGLFAGASYFNVRDVDIGGGLGRQPYTNYEQYAGDIKINQMLGEYAVVTFALQHFEQPDLARSDRFLPFVLGPAPNGSTGTQRPTFFAPQQRDLAYIRVQGVTAYENPFLDAYTATFSYSLTKEGSVMDRYANNNPNTLPNRREIGEFRDDMTGVTVAAMKDNGDFGKVTYGADYYYEDIDASRVRINNPTNPASVPTPMDPQYPDDSLADRVGTFLRWDVYLTERLSAQAGLRYENVDLSATPAFATGPLSFSRTYQDWIGSLGLGYDVTDQFKIVGGVYEGFRAPTIDDLTANKTTLQNNQSVPRLGNLGIAPENTFTYEIGAKFDGERMRFQIYEWWTDFQSYMGRETVIVGNQREEFLVSQGAYLNGTELYGEYLLDEQWSAYGNFAYTYGRIRDNGEPFPRIPPVQGILGLRWRRAETSSYFDIYTWLVGRQERYNAFNLSDVRFIPGGTPGYGTLNVRAGTTLDEAQHHRVSVALENITDQYYRVLGSGVDGTGFNAIFGYEFVY